ncbi:MAG: dihydrodipicolinate synthase family protein [Planctomycetaceae bacterium]|nr:dihydrodipicolinate synthase family protein [Planctomycetaceae bacterium]
MSQEILLRGVVPIIPTPFRDDESIDLQGINSCVEFAVRCGVCAVCLPAYGSEFYKLTEAERRLVVETAIKAAARRVGIIAQSNHPSASCAADLARRHEELGADLISFAIPRLFALPAADLLDYCRTVCRAVQRPVLIQDFNPGGPTVGAEFARALHDECPNFRYLKLEEPLMSGKVRAIREATQDQIGVLAGWGGMYLLDLIPSGICGLMPGLGPADLLQKIWQLGTGGQVDAALDLFEHLLPQLVFSLQSMELFLCLEKRLLALRQVLNESNIHVRRPTWTPDAEALAHGDFLNRRVLAAVERSVSRMS